MDLRYEGRIRTLVASVGLFSKVLLKGLAQKLENFHNFTKFFGFILGIEAQDIDSIFRESLGEVGVKENVLSMLKRLTLCD